MGCEGGGFDPWEALDLFSLMTLLTAGAALVSAEATVATLFTVGAAVASAEAIIATLLQSAVASAEATMATLFTGAAVVPTEAIVCDRKNDIRRKRKKKKRDIENQIDRGQ